MYIIIYGFNQLSEVKGGGGGEKEDVKIKDKHKKYGGQKKEKKSKTNHFALTILATFSNWTLANAIKISDQLLIRN